MTQLSPPAPSSGETVVTKLTRILKDYEECGSLSANVAVHAALDDHTFLTKTGDLLVALRVEGPDYECRDASELDQLARRFESALRVLDDGCCLYQYLLKRDTAAIPAGTYGDPVVQEAIASRRAYLKTKALHSLENYFVVAYEGWRPNKARWLADLLKTPVSRLREALSNARKTQNLKQG